MDLLDGISKMGLLDSDNIQRWLRQSADVSVSYDKKKNCLDIKIWFNDLDESIKDEGIESVVKKLGGIELEKVDIGSLGSPIEYANATGRKIVYYNRHNGKYFDESDKEVEFDYDTMFRMVALEPED